MDDPVAVKIGGLPCAVAAGTTAAAAYLQAGRVDFRQSVKGEPRGPVCGMGICQECRLTINGEPHAKSCQVVVKSGMAIEENGTGFAFDSGLSPSVRERTFDVLVVGAGPAGMAAALAAAECGANVGLVDDNPDIGGQIWRGERRHPNHADAKPWFERMQSASIERLSGTSIVAAAKQGCLLATQSGQPIRLKHRKLILATGARERFLPFPGWTLPGVMGVGGLQAMVKSGLPIAGKKIVIAGTGPLLLAVAAHLKILGAEIRLIAEQTTIGKLARFTAKLFALQPGKIAQAIALRWSLRGISYRVGCWPIRAEGSDKVQAVTLTDGRRTWTEPCDYLACGFGLVANLELPWLLGCLVADGRVQVDRNQQTNRSDVFAVGELTGVGGLDKALVEGRIAGLVAAGSFDKALSRFAQRDRWLRFCGLLDDAFKLRDDLRKLPVNETIVCRCEDVTHGQLMNRGGSREAKLLTRCGMGPCQGRVCGAATEFLYGWTADTTRPPIVSCQIGTLASLSE